MAKDHWSKCTSRITTLDNRLAAKMEPRATAPHGKLRAMRTLADARRARRRDGRAGDPMITDHELEHILEARRTTARARRLHVLRLPHELKTLWREWLELHYPDRAAHVMSLIQQMRGGKDYDSRFGTRMRGEGPFAQLIQQRFRKRHARLGFGRLPPLDASRFTPPRKPSPQANCSSAPGHGPSGPFPRTSSTRLHGRFAYTRPIVDAGSPPVPNYENTEVEALQARIAALEAELDAVRRTQAVFALGLAHDMRTPLRAVESFSYLLEQRSDQLDAQSRDHLHRIPRSQFAHGAPARAPASVDARRHRADSPADVDLSHLADWCAGELREASPEREATIDIAPPCTRTATSACCAPRAGAAAQRLDVFAPRPADLDPRDGDRTPEALHLRIRDEGIGFDPAQAGKLGEPFQRLHAGDYPRLRPRPGDGARHRRAARRPPAAW
jgi:hypothetical protein